MKALSALRHPKSPTCLSTAVEDSNLLRQEPTSVDMAFEQLKQGQWVAADNFR
jgi:hypothetical protein